MDPGTFRVTFRVRAETSYGDTLVLVGSGTSFGNWDPHAGGVRLETTAEDYPLWSTPPLDCQVGSGVTPPEYKYVRLTGHGEAQWEVDGGNRRAPARCAEGAAPSDPRHMVVDDGHFGRLPSEPFGFPAGMAPGAGCEVPGALGGPQLVIVGDGIAAGRGAWCFDGWTAQLAAALGAKFGYGCRAGALDVDVHRALQEVPKLLEGSSQPRVVLLAFSSGLEHVATCPEWDREPTCASFLQAVEGLVAKVFEAGAYPVLAGLCPHGDCGVEQTRFWRRTNDRMKQFGVPMLDWLHALSASHDEATWAAGLSWDKAHPGTRGHQRMFAAVDLDAFQPRRVAETLSRRAAELEKSKVGFSDSNGFEITYSPKDGELKVSNSTTNEYRLNGGWQAMQDSLAAAKRESPWSFSRGLYLAYAADTGSMTSVYLDSAGCVASGEEAAVPPGGSVALRQARHFARGSGVQPVFEAGPLRILLCKKTGSLLILNEADFEYNVHPMWNEARLATRKLPHGLYECDSGSPFRTAIVTLHGLQSRIKVPPASALCLKLAGPLSSVERVALLPLGDRCSTRMLLHKIELDGPCYPFDLTRTTSLADVADMVASGFEEMWYEELLHYDHDAGRVFHKKWGGLSYAHEVDDGDDPVNDFHTIAARMAKRYGGRAARFEYAVNHADRVLFIRTGCSSRGEVENFLQRAKARYPSLKAQFLLISDQPSHEFHGMDGVSHVCESFDPDRMYEDMNYWVNCAHRFKSILDRHGITGRSLYWCPNNLKEAEKEVREAEAATAVPTPPMSHSAPAADPPPLTRDAPKFSHSNLYELERPLPPPTLLGA